MKYLLMYCVVLLGIGGCATGTVVQQSNSKIDGPKQIGLDAPTAPWARYILVLEASHNTGWERRCFGGGYKFEYLNAELIDMEKNESVVAISGEGYSENCPPASGTIFGDIATAVNSQWR